MQIFSSRKQDKHIELSLYLCARFRSFVISQNQKIQLREAKGRLVSLLSSSQPSFAIKSIKSIHHSIQSRLAFLLRQLKPLNRPFYQLHLAPRIFILQTFQTIKQLTIQTTPSLLLTQEKQKLDIVQKLISTLGEDQQNT